MFTGVNIVILITFVTMTKWLFCYHFFSPCNSVQLLNFTILLIDNQLLTPIIYQLI